jgi:hypothetical protein
MSTIYDLLGVFLVLVTCFGGGTILYRLGKIRYPQTLRGKFRSEIPVIICLLVIAVLALLGATKSFNLATKQRIVEAEETFKQTGIFKLGDMKILWKPEFRNAEGYEPSETAIHIESVDCLVVSNSAGEVVFCRQATEIPLATIIDRKNNYKARINFEKKTVEILQL